MASGVTIGTLIIDVVTADGKGKAPATGEKTAEQVEKKVLQGAGSFKKPVGRAPKKVQRSTAGNKALSFANQVSTSKNIGPKPTEKLSSFKPQTDGGSALPGFLSDKFSRFFGADLSDVKVHKNSSEPGKVNAKALAYGDHIFFDDKQYDPKSKSGQALIAHELTHVVQQRAGRTRNESMAKLHHGTTPTAQEQQADDMAELFSRTDGEPEDKRGLIFHDLTLTSKNAPPAVGQEAALVFQSVLQEADKMLQEKTRGRVIELDKAKIRITLDAKLRGNAQIVAAARQLCSQLLAKRPSRSRGARRVQRKVWVGTELEDYVDRRGKPKKRWVPTGDAIEESATDTTLEEILGILDRLNGEHDGERPFPLIGDGEFVGKMREELHAWITARTGRENAKAEVQHDVTQERIYNDSEELARAVYGEALAQENVKTERKLSLAVRDASGTFEATLNDLLKRVAAFVNEQPDAGEIWATMEGLGSRYKKFYPNGKYQLYMEKPEEVQADMARDESCEDPASAAFGVKVLMMDEFFMQQVIRLFKAGRTGGKEFPQLDDAHFGQGQSRYQGYTLKEKETWVKEARAKGMPLWAGPSGTTNKVLSVAKLVLPDDDAGNRAYYQRIAWVCFSFFNQMWTGQSATHRFHEVMDVAKKHFGVPYNRFEYPESPLTDLLPKGD